jgi:hypothetical protein
MHRLRGRAGRRCRALRVLAPGALNRAALHRGPLQADNGHGCVLVRVELDKGKAAIGLQADVDDVAEALKEGREVVLRDVGDEVADVDGRVVGRRLLDDDLVAWAARLDVLRLRRLLGLLTAVPLSRGQLHHGWHRRLAIDHVGSSTESAATSAASSTSRSAWLTARLLVCPIHTDGSRPEPLAVHGCDGLLGVGTLAKGEETVAARLARVHVPHAAGVGHGREGLEGLAEDVVVHFRGQVAHEDAAKITRDFFGWLKNILVVVGQVLLGLLILVGPVDANFRVEDFAAVQRIDGVLSMPYLVKLDLALRVSRSDENLRKPTKP